MTTLLRTTAFIFAYFCLFLPTLKAQDTCQAPRDLQVVRFAAETATLSWRPSPNTNQYKIVYVSSKQGKQSISVSDTFVNLTGLKENTVYEANISARCTATDTTAFINQVRFKTIFKIDVGISKVTAPLPICGITMDSIRVNLKNFGADPQSLITYKYSVNGIKAAVPFPTDGYYTGVISRDSIKFLVFKTLADFSQVGDYEIKAWTEEFKDDSLITNDTARTTYTTSRTIATLPYFQDFEKDRDTWFVYDTLGTSSWQYGTPNSTFIDAPFSGRKSWKTRLDSAYNHNEYGYLYSPCFDLKNLSRDPEISFAYTVDAELRTDGAWLELTTNGGETWERLGNRTSGLNWYSDSSTVVGNMWTGNSEGWKIARHTLLGTKGKEAVRLRFVFRSNSNSPTVYDGFAMDNFLMTEPCGADLSITEIKHSAEGSDCGVADTITVKVYNVGSDTARGWSLGYQLNGNAEVIETPMESILAPSKSRIYKFVQTANTAAAGEQKIVVFPVFQSDCTHLNDTFVIQFTTPQRTSVFRTFAFDDGKVPNFWQTQKMFVGINAHSSGVANGVLFGQLQEPNDSCSTTTARFGKVEAKDSLFYNYRFVRTASPFLAYSLQTGDRLMVQAAIECSDNFTDIDTITVNNSPAERSFRTRKVSLAAFTGKEIRFRFKAIRKGITGSFFIDLDSIRFSTDSFATSIKKVDFLKNALLSPNPTTSETYLEIETAKNTDIEINLYNALGQLLQSTQKDHVLSDRIPLNTLALPQGAYWVRIKGRGTKEVLTLRLIKY